PSSYAGARQSSDGSPRGASKSVGREAERLRAGVLVCESRVLEVRAVWSARQVCLLQRVCVVAVYEWAEAPLVLVWGTSQPLPGDAWPPLHAFPQHARPVPFDRKSKRRTCSPCASLRGSVPWYRVESRPRALPRVQQGGD